MEELICLVHFYINTLSFLYSLRLPGGPLAPPLNPPVVSKVISFTDKSDMIGIVHLIQCYYRGTERNLEPRNYTASYCSYS